MSATKTNSLLRRKRREAKRGKRGLDVHQSFYGKTTRRGKRRLIQRG